MQKEIIIHATQDQTRVALVENGELVELFVESPQNVRTVGDIHVGRVRRVMPGLRAAFIDIGKSQDAFLHFSDITPTLLDFLRLLGQDPQPNPRLYPEKNGASAPLWTYLREAQPIAVQIMKEPIGRKGPRVSTDISLPGRFFVLMPFTDLVAVSKKITAYRERRRLQALARSLLPPGFGVIVRTVSEGKDARALDQDLQNLLRTWRQIEARMRSATPPERVYEDASMVSSVIRDLFTEDFDRILVDEAELYRQIKAYVRQVAPHMEGCVQLYRGRKPIFDYAGIQRAVASVFSRRVELPSGGHIVIEHTEAMHVIDVNSGPYAPKRDQEENALQTNLEAAREIARQLRLRDLGGIIVVDFIDLRDERNRKKVYEELKKEFTKDRAKTSVLPMSEFGLVQITRQRVRPGLLHALGDPCPACGGMGVVQSTTSFVMDIENWIRRFRTKAQERTIELHVHPYVRAFLTKGLWNYPLRWLLRHWVRVRVVANPELSMTQFRFLLPDSGEDVTARYGAEERPSSPLAPSSQQEAATPRAEIPSSRKRRSQRREGSLGRSPTTADSSSRVDSP
ncbi:MAG: Rne/Rng family ribonuclease [Bacteroidetes bacterium]|nr:Rne/Rng family ribonuclease [Rhodothermia bacterium]MCX7906931.1 Rne/Rng family ribonuclease [Bacteroidota bacterium]MDW8285341.1 Rne/Rng family ribonuclease [Bacteroidota bacterium]